MPKGGRRRMQKTSKKCHEINKISTLKALKIVYNVEIFYCHPKPFNFTADVKKENDGRVGDFNPHTGEGALP